SEVLQLGMAGHDGNGDNEGALRLFREAVARLSFVFVPTMALLAIAAPTLISFLFTDRYFGAVPIFRVAILSIPMAALPLDGVMRARAQNQFMFRVSALKLTLTVPLVWAGLKLWGPIGALGGWICAEEICRFILLRRAARLFGTGILSALGHRMVPVDPTGILALRDPRTRLPRPTPRVLLSLAASALRHGPQLIHHRLNTVYAFDQHSRRAGELLEALTEPPDVVLQNGALFAPGRPPRFPYVLLLDNTCLLAQRQPPVPEAD